MDNSDVFEALPATLDASAVNVSAHPDPDMSHAVQVTVRAPDSWGEMKRFTVHQDMAFAQRMADTVDTLVVYPRPRHVRTTLSLF